MKGFQRATALWRESLRGQRPLNVLRAEPIKEIKAAAIEEMVTRLILEAEFDTPCFVRDTMSRSLERETVTNARFALESMLTNQEIARAERTPICQDTGMIIIFADVGQDAHIIDGGINDAIQNGARRAFREGYLRASVVSDPLFTRLNTRDNSPAIVHYNIVEGDSIDIMALPKGFGSENMSATRMLKPSDGVDGVRQFIIDTVLNAGSNPCPPVVVGVGVGGTFEQCALIAKRMTARESPSANPDYARLEAECLAEINSRGVGASGFGGGLTAIAVNIGYAPTHIAGLPVAVSVSCHATRHAMGRV